MQEPKKVKQDQGTKSSIRSAIPNVSMTFTELLCPYLHHPITLKDTLIKSSVQISNHFWKNI